MTMTEEVIPNQEELVTMKKAAALLGIHPQTLRRLRAEGQLRDLRFMKHGPHSRAKVFLNSVLEAREKSIVS